jgi:hypothetical protein
VGASFEFEGRRYSVEEVENHRIDKVQIMNLQPSQAARQAGD